ncbi:response regulator [Halobacillus litoralis]|uniref:Response regulator n=1 Tax=Halobacillus litoralis TaxID=45668 RepID=A0A845DRU3_9BACI|nr:MULTISPECIES: response regulator [Halobacillus]MCA1020894.1 response regulator [Halobacillus litoralis]MYL20273.1 response regulator [Halobacillus litoralis]MYL29367.1 response regulator [Halobacillus halophilus]MYL36584.1 response regulator [Halobacillus litoralis]
MTNKILIVDDQPGIRLLLEEILKAEGHETISAKTGKEACRVVKEESLDLIIMDYNLPVMHGRDVLQFLEEMNYSSPVMIITGDSEESVRKDMDFHFVTHIITKPFDIHNLKEMVNGTLVHSRS